MVGGSQGVLSVQSKAVVGTMSDQLKRSEGRHNQQTELEFKNLQKNEIVRVRVSQ